MAGTIKVDDGTTSVSFLNSAGLYLHGDGWRSKIALENEAGDGYEDVVEVIPLTWMQTTDDVRDATLHDLHRLARKAREYWRMRKVVDPVWLEVKTPSETNTRYARIKDIYIEELDDKHYRADQPVDVTVAITREGAYTDVAPTATPTTSDASQVLENSVTAGGNDNTYVYVPADVPGDALGLAYLEMVESTAQEEIIIALRAREAVADINNFESHINAAAFLPATNVVADASAPDGQKWEQTGLSGTSSELVGAPLPFDLTYYTGNFLVYAVAKATTADIFTLTVGHNTTNVSMNNANEPVKIPESQLGYHMVYCGRISLPSYGEIPGLGAPTNYYINLQVDWAGASSDDFSVRNIFLVPIDDGVMHLYPSSTRRTVNGRIERVYPYDASTQYINTPDIVRGRYLQLRPNYYNQLHFFGVSTGPSVEPNVTFTVTFKRIARYLGIRGNS